MCVCSSLIQQLHVCLYSYPLNIYKRLKVKIIEWSLDETNIAQPNNIFIFVIINYIYFLCNTPRQRIQCRRGAHTSRPITGLPYSIAHAAAVVVFYRSYNCTYCTRSSY